MGKHSEVTGRNESNPTPSKEAEGPKLGVKVVAKEIRAVSRESGASRKKHPFPRRHQPVHPSQGLRGGGERQAQGCREGAGCHVRGRALLSTCSSVLLPASPGPASGHGAGRQPRGGRGWRVEDGEGEP